MNTTVQSGDDAGSPSVEQRVRSVIQEVLGLDAPPALEARLRGELLLSSMDGMALVLTLEDEFGGSIPDETMETVDTVADLVALIESRV